MNNPGYKEVHECRVCHSRELVAVHDFGTVPLADKLTDGPDDSVPSAPLTLQFCPSCLHLQVGQNVDPAVLFQDHYPYFSSQIPEVARHFQGTYQAIKERLKIGPEDVVLEIASNDGVLSRHFLADTPQVYGVEPSPEHAALTRSMGITTFNCFFNDESSAGILQLLPGKARLVTGSNVLAHVPDPRGFVRGLARMLANEGLIVIEVPYCLNMIRNTSFDVIFHQHYSYFSLHSLQRLFALEGLVIHHLDRIDTQGGSFRLYIGKKGNPDLSVMSMLKEESEFGLDQTATYRRFSRNIGAVRDALRQGLLELRSRGMRIAGYGAPGKAATMLNYFGIDHALLDYIVDISPSKQGKYFPFTGLKIYSLQKLDTDKPDYILILAWNYVDSILLSLGHLREKGVRFLVPYPVLKEV